MRTSKLACFVVAAILAVSLSASALHAKGGKSKSKAKDKGSESSYHSGGHEASSADSATPPGWSRGKKTGWGEGEYPPGWTKWDDGKKAKWKADRVSALTDIDGVCVHYHIQEQKRNQITEAFDEAIAGGIAINEARKKLVGALEDSSQRKALLIDTTKSVLDLLK